MSGLTTAFWGMTINNYDETDLALVQNGYPDYCREIVHTLEKGEEGTPHIQAWIKLQRQQRLSFVKKLFPRGHFRALTSDEYVANTKQYAQKMDCTAVAAAVHRFNDPLKTIENSMRKVIMRMIEEYGEDDTDLDIVRRWVEKDMVVEDYKFAKIFVSATYKQMWKQFGHEMYECLFMERERAAEDEMLRMRAERTHTHTHTDEKLSREGGITNDAAEGDDASEGEDTEESGTEQEDGEDYTESESADDEACDEGGDYGFGQGSTW